MFTIISLRLDEEIVHQLEDLAKSTDRSKSYLIREAIQHYLAEYADYRISLDRLHDIRDEIISSEEMRELLVKEETEE